MLDGIIQPGPLALMVHQLEGRQISARALQSVPGGPLRDTGQGICLRPLLPLKG